MRVASERLAVEVGDGWGRRELLGGTDFRVVARERGAQNDRVRWSVCVCGRVRGG